MFDNKRSNLLSTDNRVKLYIFSMLIEQNHLKYKTFYQIHVSIKKGDTRVIQLNRPTYRMSV